MNTDLAYLFGLNETQEITPYEKKVDKVFLNLYTAVKDSNLEEVELPGGEYVFMSKSKYIDSFFKEIKEKKIERREDVRAIIEVLCNRYELHLTEHGLIVDRNTFLDNKRDNFIYSDINAIEMNHYPEEFHIFLNQLIEERTEEFKQLVEQNKFAEIDEIIELRRKEDAES